MTVFQKKLLYLKGSVSLVLDCLDEFSEVFEPSEKINSITDTLISYVNLLKTSVIDQRYSELKNEKSKSKKQK